MASLDGSQQETSPRALAIVSGKGGSGKTLVATVIAEALALCGKRVLLVDADVGTGGLSYYLGFNIYGRIREGLTEFLLADDNSFDPNINIASAREATLAHNDFFETIKLLPVGQLRALRKLGSAITLNKLQALLNFLSGKFDYVVFDCRGGIDEDSVSVCKAASDILVVVETDAASIQASQYLVDVLTESGVGNKVVGFALNKVMDDPTSLAKTGVHFFNSEYLGAIPFDIETTRDFIKGNVPAPYGLFGRHVLRVVSKIYSDAAQFESIPVLANEEFGTITLKEPDLSRGQAAIAMFLVLSAFGYALFYWNKTGGRFYPDDVPNIALSIAYLGIALASLADGFKKAVGGVVRLYMDAGGSIVRLLFRRRDRFRR